MDKMLKVEITDEAKADILKRADAVSVNLILYGGCVGSYYAPDVYAGPPPDPENYDLVKTDGLDIYIYKDAVIDPEGLKIYILDDWRMVVQKNRFMVDGLIYEQPCNVNGRLL